MIDVQKIGAALGAEVRGVDPRRPLNPQELAIVNKAFLEHLVLRFRDAPLTPAQLKSFALQFGPLKAHVAKKFADGEIPEIVHMTNQNAEGEFDPIGASRGVGWHSDGAFEAVPAKATVLHAIAVPSRGGRTKFANMYLAYEEMPEKLKSKVEGRQALYRLRGRQSHTQAIVSMNEVKDVVHPLIRLHPETNRKSVYANPLHTLAIIGMSRRDSDDLLDELFDWCLQERFQWFQDWEVGDTVIWENRSAWHAASTDYPKHEARKFIRTTVAGAPEIGFGLDERDAERAGQPTEQAHET
jgi:taurine dioxygenase